MSKRARFRRRVLSTGDVIACIALVLGVALVTAISIVLVFG